MNPTIKSNKHHWEIPRLILLFFLAAQPIFAREWTSTDGKKLQAEFMSSTEDQVTLKRDSNGKTITFSLSRLSEPDREWIREQKAKPVEPKPLEGPFAHLITGKWELAEDKELSYLIYGKGIDANKKYPLVIGLHGQSASNENGHQKYIITPFAKNSRYQKNTAILVAPLCYQPYGATGGGWGDKPGKQVIALVKKLIKNLPIDPKRVYLYGYSMGGGGTVSLITDEPKLFAAGIVIAGWTNSAAAKVFKKVPLWAFHGSGDKVVTPDSIRVLADDLKRSKVFKYTELEGDGHGISGKVLNNEEIYQWLFAQSKK